MWCLLQAYAAQFSQSVPGWPLILFGLCSLQMGDMDVDMDGRARRRGPQHFACSKCGWYFTESHAWKKWTNAEGVMQFWCSDCYEEWWEGELRRMAAAAAAVALAALAAAAPVPVPADGDVDLVPVPDDDDADL